MDAVGAIRKAAGLKDSKPTLPVTHADSAVAGSVKLSLKNFPYVGVFRLETLTVIIVPKARTLTWDRVFNIVYEVEGHVGRSRSLLELLPDDFSFPVPENATAWDPTRQLLRVAVVALARTGSRVAAAGLPRGFSRKRARLDVPRGRPLFREQVRRRAGLAIPVHCEHASLGPDTRANRTLRAAAVAVLRHFGTASAMAPELDLIRWMLTNFDGVRDEPPSPPMTLSEAYAEGEGKKDYTVALRWAVIVLRLLRCRSRQASSSSLSQPGFLINLDTVLQDYVGMRLDKTLSSTSLCAEYPVPPKKMKRWLRLGIDAGKGAAVCTCAADFFITDLVRNRQNKPRLVCDYKNKINTTVPRSDIYEINAFMDACGANGLLIFTGSGAWPPMHLKTGRTIYFWGLGLDQKDRDIDDAVVEFVNHVNTLLRDN